MSRSVYLALFLASLASLRPTAGQTTNATCVSSSTTSWLFTDSGESPCLVWSRIQSLCLNPTSYVNVPPLLDPSFSYNPPSSSPSICQCNVVSYNLMAGCSYCQIGDVSTWDSEDRWSGICKALYTPDGLGFVQTVQDVPAYAWKPWNAEKWDAAAASSSASSYSNSPEPSGTTTLSRSFSPPTSSPTASPSGSRSSLTAATSTFGTPSYSTNTSTPTATTASPSAPAGGSAGDKYGPIVGGIAGGIVGLVILWVLIRHLRNRKRPPSSSNPSYPPRKSRGQSLLSMFGGSGRNGDRDMKRETEFITDPLSFADPRPAPKAPVGESLRYTTTQQRLKGRPISDSDMSDFSQDSAVDSGRLIVRNGNDTVSDEMIEDLDENQIRRVIKGRHQLSSPPSTDFSQPRPFSTDVQTLPSLYDPPTNAPRYTMNSDMTRTEMMGRTPLSPESRYIQTERDSQGSTIGEALDSGRHGKNYWSRQKLPPLPRER